MVELKKVSKKIKGAQVLDNITYSFENGKVYGLFGENGSGKTMLLRMVAGLIVPTEGTVTCDGKELHKDISFPNNAGIVIENMELLPRLTALENLKLLGNIRKIATEEDMRKAIIRVGLDPDSKKKVKKFSLGMKQRLNIAQAIFEKQNVILLDEPTNALDEDGVQLIYQIIEEEKKRGALIIIATHHKSDLAETCDKIIRMKNGKMISD